MNRGYEYDFSVNSPYVYDIENRERKVSTITPVLTVYLSEPLEHYDLLKVGITVGIIDNYLADYFHRVVGIDIDEPAISHAQATFHRDNLEFRLADALHLVFAGDSFDFAVCSNDYESCT